MDEPEPVGRCEPFGHLGPDTDHVRGGQRPGSVDLLLQGLPSNVLHHEVRHWDLLDGMDGDDVLVLDPGSRAGLAEKPSAGDLTFAEPGPEHLDRDHSVQFPIERPIHDPEPAPAEYLTDVVVPEPAERPMPLRRPKVAEGRGGVGRRLRTLRWLSGQPLAGWKAQETTCPFVGTEQVLDLTPHLRRVDARRHEVLLPLSLRADFCGPVEDRPDAVTLRFHGPTLCEHQPGCATRFARGDH